MTDEERLLTLSARIGISGPVRDEIRGILQRRLDWGRILQLAYWHAIAPLLFKSLTTAEDPESIPAEVMNELKEAYQGNLARNLYLQAELRRILETFYLSNIRVILLKGSALASDVYGDIGLRCMSDMDLLVRKEDLFRAGKAMSRLGYVVAEKMPLEQVTASDCHIRYANSESNVLVEIHWHILKDTLPRKMQNIDSGLIEKWWERGLPSRSFGEKAFVLSPNDLIMLLCFHFIKHRFSGYFGVLKSKNALIQLCDIYECVKHFRREIDWTKLRNEAEDIGIERLVFVTLRIVQETIGSRDDSLDDVLDRFGSMDLDYRLIRYMCKRTFIEVDLQGQFQNKVKALIKEAFPNPEELSRRLSVPLSSRMLYLQYLLGPLRICMANRTCISLCFGSNPDKLRRLPLTLLYSS